MFSNGCDCIHIKITLNLCIGTLYLIRTSFEQIIMSLLIVNCNNNKSIIECLKIKTVVVMILKILMIISMFDQSFYLVYFQMHTTCF